MREGDLDGGRQQPRSDVDVQEDDLHHLRKLLNDNPGPQTNSNDHGYDGNPGEGSEEVRKLPYGPPGVRASIDIPLELS